jgi:predicted alpha/beta-fold hydrolase
MPIISQSSYVPPPGFSNRHIQSLFPTLFRRVKGVIYERKRIWTPDDDFLDLDWSRVGAKRLVIITHGLEGNSERWYIGISWEWSGQLTVMVGTDWPGI